MNENFKSAIILVCLCIPSATFGSICSGNNVSPNWYGAVGYPLILHVISLKNVLKSMGYQDVNSLL